VNAREKNPRGRGSRREKTDDEEGGGREEFEKVYGCTRESIMQDRGPSMRPYLQRAILQRVSEREREKKER